MDSAELIVVAIIAVACVAGAVLAVQFHFFLRLLKKEELLRTSNNLMQQRIDENIERIEQPIDPVNAAEQRLRQFEFFERELLKEIRRAHEQLYLGS